MLVSDGDVKKSGMKGKGMAVLHVYRDSLWSYGGRKVPNDGFGADEITAAVTKVVEESTAAAAEESDDDDDDDDDAHAHPTPVRSVVAAALVISIPSMRCRRMP